MSDDPTRRLDPPDPTRPLNRPPPGAGGPPPGAGAPPSEPNRTPLIVAAVAVGLLILVLLVVNREGDNGPAVETASPSPTVSAEATASPDDAATDVTPSGDDAPREATDADAAEFSESFRPDGAQAVQSATADVDGDGVKEVVFASIHADAARIDVARWDGRAYRVVYTGQGGGAERLDGFTVTDYTGDDTREIVTMQSIGAQGQSLSVWGWNGQAFAPQRASGGCWDGSHTFGVTGASIERGEIRATCDGSPLPTAAWPSDVYAWDAGRGGWVYDHTED